MFIKDADRELLSRQIKELLAKPNAATPTLLLNLTLFKNHIKRSDSETVDALRKYLLNVITSKLTEYREMEGVSASHNSSFELVKRNYKEDTASQRSTELKAWSTMYYLYGAHPRLGAGELARAAEYHRTNVNHLVKRGINLLLAHLAAEEQQARNPHLVYRLKRHWKKYVETEPHDLVGVAAILPEVCQQLTAASPEARVVSLEGLGGSGKTALALAVADRLAENGSVDDIFFVTAKQEVMLPGGVIQPIAEAILSKEEVLSHLGEQMGLALDVPLADLEEQITIRCMEYHALVIIDNLETVANITELLPMLSEMSKGRTRFLLTSRESLASYRFVKSYKLEELSAEDSRKLLATLIDPALLTDDLFTLIYDAVGGIPLILRLIAGQLAIVPPALVFNQLRGVQQSETVQEAKKDKASLRMAIFEYIYWHTWEQLQPEAQQLLIGMGRFVPASGGDIEALKMTAQLMGLDADQMMLALQQLTRFYLLSVSRTEDGYFYRMHRLTYMYIHANFFAIL